MKFKILHYTAVEANELSPQIYAVNRYHKKFDMLSSLGWNVGYNWFVDVDGKLTQCRADGEEGAHTIGHNKELAICFAGNGLPNRKQINSIRTLDQRYKNLEWKFHRDLQVNRTCPGILTHKNLQSLLYPPIVIPKTEDEKKSIEIREMSSLLDNLRNLLAKLSALIK